MHSAWLIHQVFGSLCVFGRRCVLYNPVSVCVLGDFQHLLIDRYNSSSTTRPAVDPSSPQSHGFMGPRDNLGNTPPTTMKQPKTASPRFCVDCGTARLADTAKFCGGCGVEFEY